MNTASDKRQANSDQQPGALRGGALSARHISPAARRSRQGLALVITLIMLSVTLIMAIAFLAIARRERVSVTTNRDATVSRMASDAGFSALVAQIQANLRATNSSLYMYGILVSTNYINPVGYVIGSQNPTNVNYDFRQVDGLPLNTADFEQNVANLEILPRAPVMISATETNAGRFYLDLNRNGVFDDSGWVTNYDEFGNVIVDANGNNRIFEMGDPQWVGLLARPGVTHAADNQFLSRYAFIALPVGESLDFNFIHNQAFSQTLNPVQDSFFRNQGNGSWEINLAAFLADLNTNEWYLNGLQYQYQRPAGGFNLGNAFFDAYTLLNWRYGFNYRNLAPSYVGGLGSRSLNNAFGLDNIDHYSFGPMQISTTNITQVSAPPSIDPWVGSDNPNRFATLGDLFHTNQNFATMFINRMTNASMSIASGAGVYAYPTYDRYTFYRMLEQLGTDTLPGSAGKLNLNYSNAIVNYDPASGAFAGVTIVPGIETNLVAWQPRDFFYAAADAMLKVYTTNWFQRDPISYMATYYGVVYNGPGFDRYTGFGLTNTPIFGITNQVPAFGLANIPVQINGVWVYSPAVNRILQLAANIYDASVSDIYPKANFYPHAYKPILFRDANTKNVFIVGYSLVSSVSGPNDPVIIGPNVAQPGPYDLTALLNGWDGAQNYYGVPWIIGAKKSMPNFNEFYAFNTAEVGRKLQFTRKAPVAWSGANRQLFTTNQMLIMSITNHIGYSFWNSYAGTYPGNPVVYANDLITMRLAYGSYTHNSAPVKYTYSSAPSPWFGSAWDMTQTPAQRQASSASFVAGNFDFPFVYEAALDLDQNGTPQGTGFRTESWAGLPATLPPFPNFEEDTTNRFQAYILDNGHVIDYVQFYGPVSLRMMGNDLADPSYISGASAYNYMWSTNLSGVGSPPTGVNYGVQNQITVSQKGNVPIAFWQSPPNMPPNLQGIQLAEAAEFSGFFLPFWNYGGKNYVNTNLIQQAPYTPIRTLVSPTLWVANDPLVHYLSADLNQPVDELAGVTNGVAHSDDPAKPPVALPNLGQVASRYQPWGRNAQMNGVVGVIRDDPINNNYSGSYNLAYKDPLAWGSDNWDFPTNHYPNVGWLGRVHRGTPWQTVYLKATNLLDYVDPLQGVNNQFVGRATWSQWTGNFNGNDATNSRPIQDELLFDVFTTSPNDNASRGTLSVNQTHLAAWSAVLGGVLVVSNASQTGPLSYATLPLQAGVIIPPAGPYDVNTPSSLWPPLYQIVNGPYGINTLRANTNICPNGGYSHMGDILRAPALTERSPFLNRLDAFSANDRKNYDISDEMYEMIPQQIMGLLRPTGLPRWVVYSHGQALKPDPNGTVLSSSFFGLVTNYQVVAESVTRAVLTVQPVITNTATGPVTNYTTKVENFTVLPPD